MRDGMCSKLRLGVIGLWVLVGGAGLASAGDEKAGKVAEARAAYERALAELRAAEAALAEAEASEQAATPAVEAATAAASQPETVTEEQPVVPEAEKGFFAWDAWDKTIDVGINGASGNSESLTLRLQIGAERKTDTMETRANALYRLSRQSGGTTENRFRFDVLNDWLPPEGSKIRWWARGAYEYDQFQAWDHRVSGSAGLGYEIVNNDKHTLVGRAGLGGSQTFGDDDEDFRPELVLGLDYTYRIDERQRLVAGTEYLLDVSDTENWRTNSSARYEVLIDPTNGMNFQTGVTHRYDSNPGGSAKKNDTEYFATIGWRF